MFDKIIQIDLANTYSYDRSITGSEAKLDFVVGFVGPKRAPFLFFFYKSLQIQCI